MLYITLLASLALILLLLRQKVHCPWITHPQEPISRRSRKPSNTPWISRRNVGNYICGKMNSPASPQSPTSSQSMIAEPAHSQCSSMGSQSTETGCSCTCRLQSMKMPVACHQEFWETGKEKASDITEGTIIAPMSRSQGDPIAGGCITGATFVGPIQLNLGYGNTGSQCQMVSMGAESSITCKRLLSNALNAAESRMQEPIQKQGNDWVSPV